MTVSSVSSSSAMLQAMATSQVKAPDRPNDGDGDAGDAPVQAAPPPGTGEIVDKTA